MPKAPSLTRPPASALGRTRISAWQARILVGGFLTSLVCLPLVDLAGPAGPEVLRSLRMMAKGVASDWREKNGWEKPLAANSRLLAGFQEMETSMEDHGVLARLGRPPLQDLLLRAGAGNEKVYPGKNGWLFYRAEIDALTARTFAQSPQSPEEVIAGFAADLATRDILLVLLPTPGKPLIHPEKFTHRAMSAPPQNPEWLLFLERLSLAVDSEWSQRGLKTPPPVIVDPTDLLWERRPIGPQYLRTDSHWTPDAMEAVAELAARRILESTSLPPTSHTFQKTIAEISARGDTAAMLNLPASSPWNQLQDVTITRITQDDGMALIPDKSAPVLLLGDSFSNIYSQEGLGWGSSAGFPEHLSAQLGFSIDTLTRNDGGASGTRERLAAELSRGHDRLAGKKVVVWQFAMRELVVGRWAAYPLTQTTAKASGFLTLATGEQRTIEGTIQSIGSLPQLGKTPYKDYLTAVHLTALSDPQADEAIVFLQTMKNHEIMPAARLIPGQRVTLDLRSWADMEPTHGSMNRGELDDLDLQLQEPNFGTLHP